MTSNAPKRIQLRRTKGWRKPEGAIVVARPSHWGNPFRVERAPGDSMHRGMWRVLWPDGSEVDWCHTVEEARHVAARVMYEPPADVHELRGHDLACWCPLDQPCHADVLLEIANGPAR